MKPHSIRRPYVWLMLGLVLPATAVLRGADWPEWRGPARTGVSTETGLPSDVVTRRREPGLDRAVRRPIGAGGVRRSPLPAEHGRRGRDPAGTPDVLQRRYRQALVGAQIQPVHERRAAASHRLGLPRRRRGDRQRSGDQRQRPGHGVEQGREGAVGTIPRRGARDVDDARWTRVVTDHRRRSVDCQRADVQLGTTRRRRAPVHFLRQEQRADPLGRLA